MVALLDRMNVPRAVNWPPFRRQLVHRLLQLILDLPQDFNGKTADR